MFGCVTSTLSLSRPVCLSPAGSKITTPSTPSPSPSKTYHECVCVLPISPNRFERTFAEQTRLEDADNEDNHSVDGNRNTTRASTNTDVVVGVCLLLLLLLFVFRFLFRYQYFAALFDFVLVFVDYHRFSMISQDGRCSSACVFIYFYSILSR